MEGLQILSPTPFAASSLQVFSTSQPSNQIAIKTGLPAHLSNQWPLLYGGFKTYCFHSAFKNPHKGCKGSPRRIHHLWNTALHAALLI